MVFDIWIAHLIAPGTFLFFIAGFLGRIEIQNTSRAVSFDNELQMVSIYF